jgi:nucleoside phosphorylase
MPRAVILTALSVEYLAVRAHLSGLREEVHTQGTVYERGQFLAEGQCWDVGIVEIGPGNPGSAVEAERAIAYFSPDVIFLVGVAGGIKDVRIGDVVAATEVYSYEFGKAGDTFQTRPKSRDADYGLEQRARAEARKGDWLKRLARVSDSAPRVFVGPIAAGEKVIASQQSAVFQLLRSHYEDAIAVEMEGFGFLSAVRGHKQVDAIVIRGISDLIDGKGNADRGVSQEMAACHASAFAFQMLSKLGLDSKPKAGAVLQHSDGMSQKNFDNAKSWQTVVNGGNVYIGENNFYGASPQEGEPKSLIVAPSQNPDSVDELVRRVRSYVYDDIQCLHGAMPLWEMDHWVPLGELFVDVNILEEVSSNRRSELDDLWRDFSQNPGDRGLDRMGLGEERERVSGLKVLDRNTNLMVVGKPGSGKTTYLQRVVTECNAGNLQGHRIPTLIRLRQFVDDGREVDYAVECYLERCWRLSEAEVRLVLEAGRSLVLLDGLDEVMGADEKAIVKQIKRFARDYPQVQIIVTCRTQSFAGEMDWKSLRFSFMEVADFSDLQVRLFAVHWFQVVCKDITVGQLKATTFLEQLFWEENRPTRELAITPILLSLTCAVFQKKQAFYSKRSKLYEEGLDLLLDGWDNSREVARDEIYRDLSVDRKLELLSYLAVKKFEQEQYVLFEQTEIEGYIRNFLGIGVRESRGVLRAIEAQHGLLIERSKGIWSFSHLTFQEYLVAKWLVKSTARVNVINYPIQRWQEVFSVALELSDTPEELFLSLRNYLNSCFLSSDKIKKFMKWVDVKSGSVDSDCQKFLIRIFYFALESGLDKFMNSSFNKGILREIGDVYRGIIVDPFLDLDRALVGLLEILVESYRIDRHIENFSDSNHCSYARDLLRGFIDINICESELTNRLNELINLFVNSTDDLDFSTYRGVDQILIKSLRSDIIRCRNIGHDWKFTDEDLDSMRNYFKANVFFVDNLRGKNWMRDGFNQEFMENLFVIPPLV